MEQDSGTFSNTYDDERHAAAYAALAFPGTYHLAYRDLPELLHRHATGQRALDFGCGTGRSTRFLRSLGFDASGVDISAEMVVRARALDPDGDYRQIEDGDLAELPARSFDLITAIFTFDNIPGHDRRVALLQSLRRLLAPAGLLLLLDSTPEIYHHEWASFSTRDFPQNARARSGDPVFVINTAVGDPRPVTDVLWTDPDYRRAFAEAGLELALTHRPLATGDEPIAWVNETRVPPWVIYLLRPA